MWAGGTMCWAPLDGAAWDGLGAGSAASCAPAHTHLFTFPAPTSRPPAAWWNVQNVLDAAYSGEAAQSPYDAYTLNIEVQDKPGVLNQVG